MVVTTLERSERLEAGADGAALAEGLLEEVRMAGDWIPMRCDLDQDPATIAIGLALGITACEVVGRLLKVWSWANSQSIDGVFRRIPLATLDAMAGVTGFADAMIAVGWVVRHRNTFSFNNFDRWNGITAKERLQKSRRQARWRKKERVDGTVDGTVDGVDDSSSSLLSSSLLSSSSSSSLEHPKTEDAQTDIRGGGPGEGERAQAADVLEQLAYQPPFLLGEVKAHAAMARLKLTVEDLESWRQSGLPERKLIWGVQRFKRPEELVARDKRIAEEKFENVAEVRDPDERKDRILKRRQAELKAQEEAARKASVPAPPEFFEAVKRIGKGGKPSAPAAGALSKETT